MALICRLIAGEHIATKPPDDVLPLLPNVKATIACNEGSLAIENDTEFHAMSQTFDT
jgi:hypothetical protein